MKYMTVREFLRGGYQTIKEPTIVMTRGYPTFTVFPGPPSDRVNKQLENRASEDQRDEQRA